MNLDGSGQGRFAIGVPFLEPCLTGCPPRDDRHHRRSDRGSRYRCSPYGQDVGITLGQAVAKALGDKVGIRRYGHAYVPLDEALSRVVLDYSGRPGIEWHVKFPRARVGDFDVDLFFEFFQGFVITRW